MLKDRLGIDATDLSLLSLLMQRPDISQSELAEAVKLSQPSVNVRLKKLKERSVCIHAVGLDPKKAGLSMVRVDCTCQDPRKLLMLLEQCSFFVNGFLMSGMRNLSVFFIGEDLGKIEHIVKLYLRSNELVSNVEVNVVVETAKPFISSVDLAKEHTDPCADPKSCAQCKIVHESKA